MRAPGRLRGWEDYAILRQEGTVERVTSWNDHEEFAAMHAALQDLGFGQGLGCGGGTGELAISLGRTHSLGCGGIDRVQGRGESVCRMRGQQRQRGAAA